MEPAGCLPRTGLNKIFVKWDVHSRASLLQRLALGPRTRWMAFDHERRQPEEVLATDDQGVSWVWSRRRRGGNAVTRVQ